MSKVTDIEHVTQSNSYAGIYKDEDGIEYSFSLEEFTNFDHGIYEHTITWIEDEPEEVDEDDLINLFYEQLSGKK